MELTFESFLAPGDSATAVATGEPRFIERKHRAWLVPGVARRFEQRWQGLASGGALAMLAGVALLVAGFSAWRAAALDDASFRTDGVDADCAVTARRIEDDRQGQRYLVACAYPGETHLLTWSFSLPSERYREQPPGTTIAVRYLRSDPARVRLRGRTYDATEILLLSALFGIGAIMAGGGFLEAGLKRRRAEKRLEREGILLPGRVVHSMVVLCQPKYGLPYWKASVTYRFTCPCGSEIVGHETLSRYPKIDQLPENARVCVAFADPRCHRVL